jgi:pimeloyl-ACP methyl ester carboxylesterase
VDVVDGAGHFLHEERPAVVVEQVVRFVREGLPVAIR